MVVFIQHEVTTRELDALSRRLGRQAGVHDLRIVLKEACEAAIHCLFDEDLLPALEASSAKYGCNLRQINK